MNILHDLGKINQRTNERSAVFIFFIGGVQPKKVQLDNLPRPCPHCGQPAARLKRLDHYLSLFFIPLFPVKRGEPFLECDRCGAVSDPSGAPQATVFPPEPFRICPGCGRPVERDFRFCPHCGQKLL